MTPSIPNNNTANPIVDVAGASNTEAIGVEVGVGFSLGVAVTVGTVVTVGVVIGVGFALGSVAVGTVVTVGVVIGVRFALGNSVGTGVAVGVGVGLILTNEIFGHTSVCGAYPLPFPEGPRRSPAAT